MKAARLHAVGDLRVAEEPVPAAEPGSCLVRVTAVGICGSDLHWWDEAGIGDATLDRPLVLGHEAAGVIEDGPRRGERVAIDPAIPDGTCRMCRAGYRNLCLHIRFAGHGRQDGAMREFLTWPGDLLHPLPDVLSDADGAVLEPLGVAIHALDLGHLHLDGTAAVVGCGPIGLLLIQLLQVAGASHGHRFRPAAAPPRRRRRTGRGRLLTRLRPLPARRCAGSPATGWTWRSRSLATTRRCSWRWPRPARAAGWCSAASPGDDRTTFQASHRPPQGPHHRHGAPDERGLPAGDQPGRREAG